MVYVDADTLFIKPLEELWHFFSLMNSSQIGALVPDHVDQAIGWYNHRAKTAYVPPLGIL